MKKITSILLTLLLLLPTATLATPTVYITVGGFVITSQTTITQVSTAFGAPKLVTPSAFGGSAYTYHGPDYGNYLYLETNAAGKIVCYGSVDPSFVTPTIRYGDPDPNDGYTWFYARPGLIGDRTNRADIGCVCLYDATWQEQELYWSNLKNDPLKYAAGLNRHIVILFNLMARAAGAPESFAYDESLMLTNYQLYENGSDFYYYAGAVGRSSFVRISQHGNMGFATYINPLFLSWSWMPDPFGTSHTYPAFILDGDAPGRSSSNAYLVDPAIMTPQQNIAYTEQEQTQLAAARAEYTAFYDLWTSAPSIFTVQPQWWELPLIAGVADIRRLEAATAYINAVRAGAGIPKLIHDPELSDKAQHKAVLSVYCESQGLPGGHYPPQPPGVDDAFYEKSQPASGENLYIGNLYASIQNALQEAYGDVIACGHRYNLLSPSYQYFGVGCHTEYAFSLDTQGVHEFSGHQAHDIRLLAWPSAGVVPIQIYKSCFWTASFLKDYSVTPLTTVEVKHLNTGKTWTWESPQDTGSKLFYRLGASQVTFYDASITVEAGDVFETTLHNVKDGDGNLVPYTYRSVFENAYLGSTGIGPGVSLSKSALTLSVGGGEKLKATVTADANNKMVFWSSSDETVATVDAYGRIAAVTPGSAKITVTAQDGGAAAACAVTVREASAERGDANCDYVVNAADAAAILRHLVRLQTLTPQGLKNAKVTEGEGPVSAADAAKILRWLVRLETVL